MQKYTETKDQLRKFLEGCRVVEATEPLDFFVSKRHIAKGKPCNPQECVLGQSLKSQQAMCTGVVVKRSTVFVKFGKTVKRYMIYNKGLRNAILGFDVLKQWSLGEGWFTLSPPAPSQTRAAFRKRWDTKTRPGYKAVNKPGSRRPSLITRVVIFTSK